MTSPSALNFFEHLEELRKRILIGLAALLAGTILGYLCSDRALELFLSPILGQIGEAYFFSPAEALIVKLKVALFLGAFVSSPVIFWQFWIFISPALYQKEKSAFLFLVSITAALFVSGALFSFYVVLPPALHFFVGMRTPYLKPMISVTEYISFLSGMSLAFGVAFNLPVVLLGLTRAGIVNGAMLRQYRRHAVVLIFIAAAILTPGPDIASQLMLAAPLFILFEASVFLTKVFEPGKRV